MDTEVAALTTEAVLLGWSVVLLLAHIAIQGTLATMELGVAYNATPRDENRQPKNIIYGRAERALKNFLETYPAFVALALALEINADSGGIGTTGALIWFWARIVYLPLYLAGIPYVRTLAWLVSVAGLALMLWALLV